MTANLLIIALLELSMTVVMLFAIFGDDPKHERQSHVRGIVLVVWVAVTLALTATAIQLALVASAQVST